MEKKSNGLWQPTTNVGLSTSKLRRPPLDHDPADFVSATATLWAALTTVLISRRWKRY